MPRRAHGSTAPSSPVPSTASRSSSRRVWRPWPAVRSTSGRPDASTSTPPRSDAPSPARCSSDHARGRRRHLGRRLDLQGQRHRALLPLRPHGQPAAAHLQALARRRLRGPARRPRRDEPVAHRARPALPGQQGEGLLHRREHLGRHPRGEDPGAPRRLAGDGRADHGREVLGPLGRDRARGRHHPLRPRSAGRDQRQAVRRHRGAGPGGERRRRAARPGHVGPDREPDHRGQVARGLRGPGHGAALHRVRAAAQRDPQRGHDRELPRDGPSARPDAATRVGGSTPRR